MGLISKLFWIGMFLVATFLWLVLFEHGPSGFVDGIPVEWEKLQTFNQPVNPPDEPKLP